MRKLVAVSLLGVGILGLASQALADDVNTLPPAIDKLTRGISDVAFGLPEEIVSHTVGAASEYGSDSAGDFVASTIGGVVVGAFWGWARMASGFVDVFTFPVAFDDNQPPIPEPDHAL